MVEKSRKKGGKRWFVFLLISAFVFIADISTKSVIEKKLPVGTEIKITSFFNIVHVRNRGTIFGLFSDIENKTFRLIFNAMSISALLFLVYFSKFFSGLPFYIIGGMLGGALGNIYERLWKGYVVDFLDFHIGKYHWPAFNVADSMITLGMIVILISSFKVLPYSPEGRGKKIN